MPTLRDSVVQLALYARIPTVVIIIIAALSTSVSVAQSVPADALAYRTPELTDAQRDLEREARDLEFVQMLDGVVTFEPSVTYADDLRNDDPASWSTTTNLTATAGFTYDRRQLLANAYQVAAAQARVDTVERRGIRQALLAHASLLQQQIRVQQRERSVVAAEGRLQDVEARFDEGAANEADVEAMRLELQRERRVLQRDVRTLDELRDEVATYGLDPEARYESIRFVLPEVPVEATIDYQRLTFLADQAGDTLTQRSVFGIVRDAYVTGTYATGDVSLRGQAGLADTRPRLEIETEYPGGHDRWSVGVEATIELNANLRDLPELREDVELAIEDRRAYVERFPDDVESARADVAFAEEGVALDEQGLDLARRVASDAQAAFDEARDALLAAGEDADRDALEAAVDRTATDLDRAEARLLGARNSLYNSWRSYVANVARYLDLVEAEWEVAR